MASTTDRLPAFPARRLFALADSEAQLHATLHALAPHTDATAIRVLTGEEGACALALPSTERTRRGRLRRALHSVASHRDELAGHARHLARGGYVLVIPVGDPQSCDQLARTLADHGAHGLLWFARYTVVDVTPRYRAVSTPAVLIGASTRTPAAASRAYIPAPRAPQAAHVAA